MCKRAPVGLLRADWISPGKFLVLVEGEVAAVDEAFRVGVDVGGDRVVDRLILQQAHDELWPALRGEATRGARASTRSGSSRPRRSRPRCSAPTPPPRPRGVRITEMQLGRGIGGKAFFTLTGPLEEVEAAVEAAIGVLERGRRPSRPRSSRRRTPISSASCVDGQR